MSSEYLAEEMQGSIDKFEKGILKHFNAYISITYDAVCQRLKVTAQNEKQVRIVFPNQFAHILSLDPTMIGTKKICSNSMSTCNIILVVYMFIQTLQVTFIGDTVAPILRIVPFSHNSKTGYVYKEFKLLHYVLVSKSVVDQVRITTRKCVYETLCPKLYPCILTERISNKGKT